MQNQKRYLHAPVTSDLKRKMVFLGGPRQVGKTTFSLTLLSGGNEKHPAYINWDHLPSPRLLLQGELPVASGLVIFDEIHKYSKWRNLLKGIWDVNKKDIQILVTGSARLDYYRRGGDSLLGRYHYYRLHPFSLRELSKNPNQSDVKSLLKFGGFPEPLFAQSENRWRRWQRERLVRVIQEDLVSLESVKMLDQITLMAQCLPERVGSLLSIKNLAQDLSVAFQTAEKWIMMLENLYYCYRIKPFGVKNLRAVKKEQKLYLWDWSACINDGARFENLVASQLLKYCHWIEDTTGHEMSLNFFRDSDKREVDFIVCQDKKPIFAVECKTGEKALSPHIAYLQARSKVPHFYQVHLGNKITEIKAMRTTILPFAEFCKRLNLP